MKLYEITEMLRNALENLEIDEDGCIVNFEELENAEEAFESKVEGTGLYITELERTKEAAKAEAVRLADYAKSLDRRIDAIKAYVIREMKAVERGSVETERVRVKISTSERVIIDREDLIPAEFIKTKTETVPDKTALKKALKLGEIPGAYIERRDNLQIR